MNFNQYTVKSQEAIQKATELASSSQHQAIEPAHILKGILLTDENLLTYILKKIEVVPAFMNQKIDTILSGFPKVSGSGQYLSNDSNSVLQKAETYRLELKDEFVTIEHILFGILSGKDATAILLKNNGLTLTNLKTIIKELRGKNKVTDQNAESKYNSLKRYSKNLNELAQNGKLDPVIGRDEEIRRLMQILSRRTKNNPVLVGEPGVGKTAIAEGLAQRIASGDVPENLKNKKVISLDLGLLIAGAKFKGEFEERLKSVMKEVIDSEGEIILFIDEIHTLIGAGSGEGSTDAANLLKPALSKGELHAIGATTLNEYQKYIEKDKALERRFQKVMVDEPDTADAISILRGLREKYEIHHGVRIKDDAIIAAVELSQRYISDRFLPDKAIDLIDEAASKLKMEIDSLPVELDELQRKIMQLEIEREAVKRDNDKDKIENLSKEISNLDENRKVLTMKWKNEKDIIEGIKKEKETIEALKHQAELAERTGDYGKVAELRYGKIKESETILEGFKEKIKFIQSNSPLLKEEVDSDDIAEIVAKWTGIPVSRMLQSEREKLLLLEQELSKKVAGQEDAILAVSNSVRRSRAGLQDVNRPLGSFIFMGTTGVGKTELAKTLAGFLFNTTNSLIRIDMSEYQEKHSVSRMIGAPPGYIGYEEGGQLTEAIRRKPYSVILLDEIEKAHPDVFNILLQVLDEGRLTDNKGRTVNFKNTIIIMTSNIGSDLIREKMETLTEENREQLFAETKISLFELLKKTIRPEFLNRVDEIILFKPLNRDEIRKVVDIQFAELVSTLALQDIKLSANEKTLDWLAQLGYSPEFGARPLKRVIQRYIVDELSKEILKSNIRKGSTITITLSKKNEFVFKQE